MDVFMRCIAGLVCGVAASFAIPMISLLVWNSIFNSWPFFATFLGWLLLGEKLIPLEIFALVASFFGVLCIASSHDDSDDASSDPNDEESSIHTQLIGCGLALGYAIL